MPTAHAARWRRWCTPPAIERPPACDAAWSWAAVEPPGGSLGKPHDDLAAPVARFHRTLCFRDLVERDRTLDVCTQRALACQGREPLPARGIAGEHQRDRPLAG